MVEPAVVFIFAISLCCLISIFRFLLKSLLQYQALTDGEIPPTPNSSCHPPLAPLALTPGPTGAAGLSGGSNLLSVVTSGEEGTPKKPKKERKERGRENGKEECEYCFHHPNIYEKGHGPNAANHKEQNSVGALRNNWGLTFYFVFCLFLHILYVHKTTEIIKNNHSLAHSECSCYILMHLY